MTEFWLDNFTELLSVENFNFSKYTTNTTNTTSTTNKIYNIISLVVIIIGLMLVYKTKKPMYFGIVIVILSVIILLKSSNDKFTNVGNVSGQPLSNRFVLKAKLLNNTVAGSNRLLLTDTFNINKGDTIVITDTKDQYKQETNVIADVIPSPNNESVPVIILLNNLKHSYSKNSTQLLKVDDVVPNVVPPPDGNVSILRSPTNGRTSSLEDMTSNNYSNIKLTQPVGRDDWNLELSSYRNPGKNTYQYQGPPYGDLKCRESTINNPMGTVNILEYDAPPTMYGTCNVSNKVTLPDGREVTNDYVMTNNFEKGVSMRVDDLLFHKKNAQTRFAPMAVDTIPDNQTAFANFCYRSPTNLINPKYASVFVNDPMAFKLVTKLAKATGTENGGGGGGGGVGRG